MCKLPKLPRELPWNTFIFFIKSKIKSLSGVVTAYLRNNRQQIMNASNFFPAKIHLLHTYQTWGKLTGHYLQLVLVKIWFKGVDRIDQLHSTQCRTFPSYTFNNFAPDWTYSQRLWGLQTEFINIWFMTNSSQPRVRQIYLLCGYYSLIQLS